MKPLVFTLFLFAFTGSCLAQKQWQLRLGSGYDFSTASRTMLSKLIVIPEAAYSKSVTSSFGRGLGFNADITCWMNRYFGFTAGAAWHTTMPPVKGTTNLNYIDYSSEEKNTWHSRNLLATAGIALKIPDTKLNPYARMGMLLPVYSRITSDDEWKTNTMFMTNSGTSRKVYKLRNTAGYSAAVGIAPALNKHTAVFAEISVQSLAILARHSTITSYKSKGVEQVNTFNVYSRETDYVKKLNNNNTYSGDSPNQQPTFSFPYSSIGIHIGISFKL